MPFQIGWNCVESMTVCLSCFLPNFNQFEMTINWVMDGRSSQNLACVFLVYQSILMKKLIKIELWEFFFKMLFRQTLNLKIGYTCTLESDFIFSTIEISIIVFLFFKRCIFKLLNKTQHVFIWFWFFSYFYKLTFSWIIVNMWTK